jgi:hypothetical protein
MLEEFRAFIAAHEWRFAKTMPYCPHYYVVRNKVRDDAEFLKVIQFIRTHGYDESYRPGAQVQRYLDVDGWKYWTMGCSLDVTVILNRAERDWVKRPIRPNPKRWVCHNWKGMNDPEQVAKYRAMRGGSFLSQ